MGSGQPRQHRLRWRLEPYWDWVVLAIFAVPKALSLLVPRRRDLIVLGAGLDHVENVLGVLSARPGPPPGTVLRVIASPRHRADPRLVAAVAALPDAKILRRWSLPTLWACLRAGWVVVAYRRTEAWRFWLGRARLAYINHGPWMKRMAAPLGQGRVARLHRFLYGRIDLVLASVPDEVAEYHTWLGSDVEVLTLGYPRSPVLDAQRREGTNPHKVGLWPTWLEIEDPSYGPDLARRLHAALAGAGVADACVDYRPHPLSGAQALLLGHDDGRRPGLIVTDFSSVCFDQFYRGGKVLLYSRRLDAYLGKRGIRPQLEPWLREHVVQDEAALVRRVVAVVAGKAKGAPDPIDLQPFDSATFWRRLLAA